ncbi:hypothetical protein ARMGADRAFT_1037764 [Armillaria gallica]|uniref:Uncharacterized protein n=1 Tax=Armillaria gallica TaxID=47427 RepID=A0A2H3D5I9_ARMGA|nr:hypothetical protein ARMGADRAFT_1037764 [Armillaria gallica]
MSMHRCPLGSAPALATPKPFSGKFLGYLQKPIPLFHDERFSFGPRDLEPERVLAQMSSADDNWVSSFTRVFHTNTIFLNGRVYDMKLLLGGKYLVIAVEGAAHVIAVFKLCGDHPDQMTFRLVSSTNISHRAFQLQTQFMPFQGDPCLFIGYVYRCHGLGSRNNSVDLSEINYFYMPAYSSVQYIW